MFSHCPSHVCRGRANIAGRKPAAMAVRRPGQHGTMCVRVSPFLCQPFPLKMEKSAGRARPLYKRCLNHMTTGGLQLSTGWLIKISPTFLLLRC